MRIAHGLVRPAEAVAEGTAGQHPDGRLRSHYGDVGVSDPCSSPVPTHGLFIYHTTQVHQMQLHAASS